MGVEQRQPMTEVAAALIREDGRILICRRPAHKARGLLWEFPGGKLEPGETPGEALERECREELGCRVEAGEAYLELTHHYPDLTVRLTLCHARIAEGRPQRLEHAEIRWAAREELEDFEFCPADREIVRRLVMEGTGRDQVP